MSSNEPLRNYCRALETNLKTCAKGTKLRVYNGLSRGVIVVVQISLSKLFPLKIDYAQPCLIVEVKDTSWL